MALFSLARPAYYAAAGMNAPTSLTSQLGLGECGQHKDERDEMDSCQQVERSPAAA